MGLSRACAPGGNSGLHGGGTVRKQLGQFRCWSKMPSWETLLEEQKWEEGSLPVPEYGPLEEAVVWRAVNMGSRSREDQRLYLGPWEQNKSCYLQQEPLLTRPRPSAVSPSFEASRPPSTAPPPPALGCC